MGGQALAGSGWAVRMSIRTTYAIAKPAFKAHMPESGRGFHFRNVSTRSMGRVTTKGESKARELLSDNDDWPTRRARFRPTVKRMARVAKRREGSDALRRAQAFGFTPADLDALADTLQ
jgi:hypothetical protein